MELTDLIARGRRVHGLSCQNCSRLSFEYDLDTGGPGVWTCSACAAYANSRSFPFESDMPCFELSFWFSIFSENLRPNDEDGCERAMSKFAESMATVASQRPVPETAGAVCAGAGI